MCGGGVWQGWIITLCLADTFIQSNIQLLCVRILVTVPWSMWGFLQGTSAMDAGVESGEVGFDLHPLDWKTLTYKLQLPTNGAGWGGLKCNCLFGNEECCNTHLIWSGYRNMRGALQGLGHEVQWERVMASMHRVDSIGVVARMTQLGCVVRHTYSVPCPKYLLHIDTNHKLMRWKTSLGCLNGILYILYTYMCVQWAAVTSTTLLNCEQYFNKQVR